MKVTKETVEHFLEAFFSPPNRLKLDMVENDLRLRVFSEYVGDIRTLSAASVVLPSWRQNSVDYYGMAFNDHDLRQLGNDINSFIGCSYSTFVEKRWELDTHDPIDAIVSQFCSGHAYKFHPDSGDPNGARRVTHKLALMRDLSIKRQSRRPGKHLPLHMLLRDYYMAVEAENRANAEKAIDAMRVDGLLDAVNLLFLHSFVVCRFGSLEELEYSRAFRDLLSMRRPLALTEELISLIYRTEFIAFEESRNIPRAIEHLKTKILPMYADLYRSWHPMRSAEAAKSFMLVAAASHPPDSLLRDAILTNKSEFKSPDAEWLLQIAETFPGDIRSGTPQMGATLDAQLHAALAGLPTIENIRALCRFAAFTDSLEIRQAIRSRYAQLPPEAQQELRGTQIAAAVLDEFLEPPTKNVAVPIPQNWADWLDILEETPQWPKAVDLARQGASEWILVDGNTDPAKVSQALLRVQGRVELRLALPHVVESARRDSLWPRPEWRVCYEAMMDIIANYTQGSIDDLTVWSDLLEVILQMGLTRERYLQICSDAADLWNTHASAATLDWATELIDTLLYFPCPDSTARLHLFVAIASRAHVFKRQLEPRQTSFLQALAEDFAQTEWAAEFSTSTAATGEPGTTLFQSLNGKILAIYSLTERVSKRVKTLLQSVCPQVDVRTNADHVGTPALRKLSKDADIFIVNTASAKHAATTFISSNRPSAAVTLFHNTRGSQSMMILLQQYLTMLND